MIELIDTHQHLIYPDVASVGWTAGIDVLDGKAFTLDDYKALTQGRGIVGSLFMETAVDDGLEEVETRHVAGLAEDPASGIVGLIATARPETDAGFDAWLETAKSLGSVGIRRILHVVDDEMSRADTFRANVAKIGAAGLVFDMCYLARQLPIARELAVACPDTTFVLDHCGVPDIAGGGLDPWRQDISALAELENVNCKLSGILAYTAPEDRSRSAIGPFVDHVLEAFGTDRVVWGSDWPVVDMANGLPDWLDVTQEILGELGADEANAIGTGNARRLYGLAA